MGGGYKITCFEYLQLVYNMYTMLSALDMLIQI